MTRNDFLRIVAIETKIISLSSFLIGTVYAATAGAAFSWPLFWLMLGAVLSVDLATASFNNYFDFRRGVDTKESDLIGDKVLVHRPLDPRLALRIAGVFYLLAATLGLAIGALAGYEIVIAGALCMAVAFFYSGGPRPLAETPFGELFAGGFLGLVLVVLAAYVQTGTVDSDALLLGIPSTLLIASILTVNNTCDLEGDRRAGRRTWSIALGRRAAAGVVYASGALAYGVAFVLIPLGVLPAIGALPLAAAAFYTTFEYRRLHRTGYTAAAKGRAMGAISRILMVYTLAVIVARVM